MSVDSIRNNDSSNLVKILSGKTSLSLPATGGGSVGGNATINHNLGFFPLIKGFMSIDSSSRLFTAPSDSLDPTFGSQWFAVAVCTMNFNFDATTLTFNVTAWDGKAHTCLLYYLIYAEKTVK